MQRITQYDQPLALNSIRELNPAIQNITAAMDAQLQQVLRNFASGEWGDQAPAPVRNCPKSSSCSALRASAGSGCLGLVPKP